MDVPVQVWEALSICVMTQKEEEERSLSVFSQRFQMSDEEEDTHSDLEDAHPHSPRRGPIRQVPGYHQVGARLVEQLSLAVEDGV